MDGRVTEVTERSGRLWRLRKGNGGYGRGTEVMEVYGDMYGGCGDVRGLQRLR